MKNLGNKRIAIIGTHGIPPHYGGFETFANEISRFFVDCGMKIAVQCDSGSYDKEEYEGISLYFSKVKKSGNPIRYYYEGLRWALGFSDIIIVAGSGGAIFYFMKLFYRNRIIITNPDGLEHKRAKWPFYIRLYLKISEILAVYMSDYVVSDSKAIAKYLLRAYRISEKKLRVIEYGAHLDNTVNESMLVKHGLKQGEYYLAVCRIEPENNLHIILEGFSKSDSNRSLVVVGTLLKNDYVDNLVRKYSSQRIVFYGGIYDLSELTTLRFFCRAYIHGHSVGGTNPSLLEAMANGNLIICHRNDYNREVTDDKQLYFGSVDELMSRVNEVESLDEGQRLTYGNLSRDRIKTYYNWNRIGQKYLELLNDVRKEYSL